MKREISSFCVVFLILLCNCHALISETSCITWSGQYGFCQKYLHFNNFAEQNPDCGDHETCYSFERNLNTTGREILREMWKDCGKLQGDRIAGGSDASLFEFPWMALLVGGEEKCAGTLITNRWVLTAAHCIKSDLYAVKLGDYDLRTEPDCPPLRRVFRKHCAPSKLIHVEKVVKHPQYNEALIRRDIALIKLKEPVDFTKNIAPVCMPIYQHHTNRQAGGDLTIAGWGFTEKGYTSEVLQKAKVRLVETSECAKHYKLTPINRSHICAQGMTNVGTCKGDSGGPLIQYYANKEINSPQKYIQIGVISHGNIQCGEHPFPYPYSSVVDAMPWITSVIDS